jgi:Relaxase/Mobilisation nuclease domain
MIAKAIKGKGFRGALEYDLSKEHGRVIDTNMEGDCPRELAREFGAIRKLRRNLGRAVLHVSLSAAPGEMLTDDQWREIGHHYLHGMGLDANQYLITRHLDTEHEHVHLLESRRVRRRSHERQS